MTPARWAHEASRGRWVCPPHLDLLNRKLTRVAAGLIPRLMICMPPRHGKSEFTSRYFPAWYLCSHPDRRVILASYEADFAAQWGRKVRGLLKEHGEHFGVRVSETSSAADRWDIEGREGGMQTAGVGGPLTGKGCHILIIDDPVKNAEEALSPTKQAAAWDWYVSTAMTRVEPGGAQILIQTRWHQEDLAGKILASAKRTGEAWDVVNLPALAEDDDPLGRPPGAALWPARYSRDALLKIKATQDDPAANLVRHWFDALYQQRPVPAEGGLFKKPWLLYYDATPDGQYYRLRCKDGLTRTVKAADCRRFGVMDLAFSQRTSADYTVIQAWAVTPDADLILLDMLRDRIEGPDLLPAAERMILRHGLAYLGIEDVQAQTLLVQQARRKSLTVKSLHPDRDKVTRAIPASVRVEAGQVFLPIGAPWLGELETELLTFPNGAHDDAVDCLAYACLEVSKTGGSAAETREAKARRELIEREDAEAMEKMHRDWQNPMWWQN